MKISISENPAIRGMLCMLVGTLLLTTQDGISKWLMQSHHAGEVMIYRGVWAFPVIAVFAYLNGGWRSLKLNRPKAVIVRAFLALITSFTVVLSFKFMPLAEALAVIFMAPLILTVISPVFLGEAVGWRRWLAVALGFIGMIVMLRPDQGIIGPWVAFPIVAAIFSAARDAVTRRFGQSDPAATILFYTMLLAVIAGAVTLPFSMTWPTPTEWLLCAASGIILAFANLLLIMAFQFAEATAIAPLKYLSLVWAAFIGFMVWGDVPDGMKMLGAFLVVAAGLYTMHRETKVARRR